jgi:hypothetical protein
MTIHYYILDSETSGLSTIQHEVVEVSIIRCSDKVQITRNIKAEHPHTASLDALAVTKKTLADLSAGEDKEKVVDEINAFFEEDKSSPKNRCIVAHNASFDKKFIHTLWEKCGKIFPANMWLDTIALTRLAAKQQGIIKPKVNLEAACDLFGIKKTATFHNAKMDTRNTYFLWKKLIEEMNIDYIPLIKTIPHASPEEDEMELMNAEM